MNSSTLTFELADEAEMLEIHGNREGLLRLAEILTALAEEKVPDHTHLMTEAWGGRGLSSETQGISNKFLNHVKIFIWPKAASK